MYDVVVVGAGIIGCFIAHDLSKRDIKVALIDKESDVANQATMANSAIIHSGHDPLPGTMKAKMNLRGNQMYEEVCQKLGVAFKRTSAFVAATSEEEEAALDILYNQSVERNIPVSWLTGDEAREKEPNLSSNVTKAIELPTTGIISPWEVSIALAEECVLNGVDLRLEEEVTAIEKKENGFVVTTENSTYETKYVINAAGVYAEKIYGMVTENEEFHINPRKGEYFVLDRLKQPLVERVIYPVPSSAGKGVLAVPTVHGNILLGPNSDFVEGLEENNNTKEHLDYVKKEVQKTVTNIPMDKAIRNFAGLRPTGDTHDFVIEESKKVEGFINVACIESPGIASAPAIAEYVVNEILAGKVPQEIKSEYKKRTPIIDLKKVSKEERAELVKKNPAYGKIVCRCEQVTEGEILDAIHRPVGAKTVKGVKKRVRPGMGRCQGGFCEPLVVDILARELGISPMEVKLDSRGSKMLVEETKA